MKKLIFVLLLIIFVSKLYSQNSGDFITLKNGGKVRTTPNASSSDTTLDKNTVVVIINKEINTDYYYIRILNNDKKVIKSQYAYINSMWLTAVPDGTPTKPLNVFETYILMYGQPNSKSVYNDGDYHSQTYVWHCAQGRYRSIDFIQNESGVWAYKSEYESECIK